MAGNRPTDPQSAGHETADVDTKTLTRLGIALLLGIVASLFLVWFVFDHFLSREASRGAAPSQEAGATVRRLPPEPRLQATPIEDLKHMRAAEDRVLGTYGWLDRTRGVVHIPIERAIELVVREGLPSRQTPGPLATDDATVPTSSGLGPVMTQVGGPLSPNREFPPDQPLVMEGTGSLRDGRQAGGPPTPPDRSLAREP